jgi:hypothetical protein
MWTTEATATTSATPETIWQLWSDVANWKIWDAQVESSSLQGPFAVGSHTTLQQKDGPELSAELIEVQPLQKFVDQTTLPQSTTLKFIHEMNATASGTHIIHSIVLDGPLAEQFAAQLGDNLRHGLEDALQGLVRVAESRQ